MKKSIIYIMIFGVSFISVLVNSCAPDYQTEFEVKSLFVPDKSLSPISFPIEGGEANAEVQTNVELSAWSATSNSTWLTVEKREGGVTIKAGNNEAHVTRIARVTIKYGHQEYHINVSQSGKEAYMLVDDSSEIIQEVSAVESSFAVIVKSNMQLDHILIPDTADFVKVSSVTEVEGSENEKMVTFLIDKNPDFNPQRYSTITFQSSDNYDYTASLVIVQAERYPVIPLTVDMLSTNAQQPTEGPIANLIDGNPNTYFHSIYSASISEMHHFQIAFNEPIEGFVFWYQNRNNSNGKATNVSVLVSADGEEWDEIDRIDSGLPTNAASTYLSKNYIPEAPISYLRFVVNATNDGVGPRFFNMAEFVVYSIQE